MLNSDIGDLERKEVDLKKGYITRPRSKSTKAQGKSALKVSYKLWDTTKTLLKKCLATTGKLALLSDDQPIFCRYDPDKSPKERDCVEPVFKRIIKKAKIEGKSLRNFRDTGASKLYDSEFASYKDVYLCHKATTVSEIHYAAHPEARFTLAMEWLEKQFDFLKLEN